MNLEPNFESNAAPASGEVVIRRAVVQDAVPACDVVRRSIVQLCTADHHGDEPTLSAWLKNKTDARFVDWIGSEGHVAVVAERAAAVIGFGLLTRAGNIILLYVDPAARFEGVTKLMLDSLERLAAESGIGELTLQSSTTALRFYERRGYSRSGQAVQGFGITLGYPMRKRLTASNESDKPD